MKFAAVIFIAVITAGCTPTNRATETAASMDSGSSLKEGYCIKVSDEKVSVREYSRRNGTVVEGYERAWPCHRVNPD